jgi:selenide,water dikinase
MTPSGSLLLAGGGHSHALLLKRWAMTPRLRPKRSIVLINRHPTALYSGMVPGLIAGIYRRDELSINLPHLCDRAGVAFVQAEISGIDSQRQDLLLHQRPALSFGVLSLDVGAVTRNLEHLSGVPIKPLEEALQFLSQQDPEDPQPFRIVGAGPAGIEVALALRRRWPRRPLELQIRAGQLNATTKSILRRARHSLRHRRQCPRLPPLHGKSRTVLAGQQWICGGSRRTGSNQLFPPARGIFPSVCERRLRRDGGPTAARLRGVGCAFRRALGPEP